MKQEQETTEQKIDNFLNKLDKPYLTPVLIVAGTACVAYEFVSVVGFICAKFGMTLLGKEEWGKFKAATG